MQDQIENASSAGKMNGEQREVQMEDGTTSKFGTKSSSPYNTNQKKAEMEGQKNHQMPPASVMTRLILIMVWRKLIRNPNTYSSLLGLIWSLVSYRSIFLTLSLSLAFTYIQLFHCIMLDAVSMHIQMFIPSGYFFARLSSVLL